MANERNYFHFHFSMTLNRTPEWTFCGLRQVEHGVASLRVQARHQLFLKEYFFSQEMFLHIESSVYLWKGQKFAKDCKSFVSLFLICCQQQLIEQGPWRGGVQR